ncbi:unnamed protein product, partial [Prunus brigantina]
MPFILLFRTICFYLRRNSLPALPPRPSSPAFLGALSHPCHPFFKKQNIYKLGCLKRNKNKNPKRNRKEKDKRLELGPLSALFWGQAIVLVLTLAAPSLSSFPIFLSLDMSHDAKRQVKSQEAKKGKRPRAIASQLGKRLGFQVERLLVFFCFFLFKVASC